MNNGDKDLMVALKNGNDEVVLAYLYKTVLPKVKHYIKSNKGNDDEANDIFQDAVINFYNKVKLNKIEDTVNVSAYITQTAKNLWINRVKRMNRSTEISNEDSFHVEEDFLGNIITQEKTAAITKLLSEIGEECQQLLKYSVYENLSMREICKSMGYSSENLTKNYNYRCKQKLIQLVMKNKAIENLLRK
jgi:RNA polymerase sigma factor (sigma-70 family)